VSDVQEKLEQEGVILRGHYVLLDGHHSDRCFDRRQALASAPTLGPVFAELGQLIQAVGPTHITGGSLGGMVVASQVAMQTGSRIYYIGFEGTILPMNPEVSLAGARVAIVDDCATGLRQFDPVVHLITGRGGSIVALGAAVALSQADADEPVCPFFSPIRVDARVFPAGQVPEWLARLSLQFEEPWFDDSEPRN
jgi:orotate phosphoribosyltransferase